MTVNKITNAPTQNEIINSINDLIDNKQDTLIAGTDLEIVNATTPRLPAGYTELEWLQSDGACCIDLGVISYGNDEVEQKFQRPSTFESNIISWFGSIQNSAVPRFSIGASSSSGVFAGFNFTKPLAEYDNNIHIISLKKVGSTYYAGFDEATASYAPTSASTNPSINSYLFARNSSTITYDGTGTRIFYHKQNRFDGTPLLDLVPAKRDSDNALGMYNLVSNTFLGNSGTGTFTGGPEVIYPTTTTINFTNESGYIKGIDSTDVITALGYTPYDSANPDGYTSNVGTVTSVNNIEPDENGNVTIQAGGATDVQINSTSVTNQGVANILTQTAYNATSNKIATMSDLPASEIFIATYGTTTFNEVRTAYDAGKTVFVKEDTTVSGEVIAVLNYFEFNSALDAHFEFASSILNDGTYYTYTLDQDSTWDEYTEQIPDTSGFEVKSNKVTSISSSSTNTQYPSAKSVIELLKTIYPVGSVYLSTNSTCPLASLFGTWDLVSSGKALWTGTGSNGNTTISASLPNIKGVFTNPNLRQVNSSASGAFSATTSGSASPSGGSYSGTKLSFDAHSSNTMYSDSATTVQPPAYVVNVWRRTA